MDTGREVGLRSLDEQVKVICHQAVGHLAPTEALQHSVSHQEEHDSVIVIVVDGLPAVPARGDVKDAAGDLNAQCSAHGHTVGA
jgi:hypothetical protein